MGHPPKLGYVWVAELMQPKILKLEVILANVRDDDRDRLRAVLTGTPWTMIDAGLPDIANVVREASIPIVLCERSDSNEYRKILSLLRKARREVCVILLAGEGDVPGAQEVAQCGAFDLLTRPLRREQVLPTLLFAYAHCCGHAPYLSRRRGAFPNSSEVMSCASPTATSRKVGAVPL